VTQDKGPRQAGVADARFLVPVQIRAAQPDGGHSEEDFARAGSLGRFHGDTDVAPTVDAGSFDGRLPGGHFRLCP
jgi:hypothetical protein